MPTHTARIVISALIATVLGCASDLVEAPPTSAAITHASGTVSAQAQVLCEGPEDEIAQLGPLCGFDTTALGWRRTDGGGAGMAMDIGPEEGPLLLIFNQVEYEPDSRENVASDLSYAAYLVLDERADDWQATLEQWPQGEAILSGEVITEHAQFIGCHGDSWRGEAVLVWRNTTLTLAWSSGSPC